MWDWKSALGLAEEKRDYEIDGGSIKFLHIVKGYISKPSKVGFRRSYLSPVGLISMPLKRGLDNVGLPAEKGNDAWRYRDLTFLVRMSDLKSSGFVTKPKATPVIFAFIRPLGLQCILITCYLLA